jgi:tetratricopeptide (TPR) repeat protein
MTRRSPLLRAAIGGLALFFLWAATASADYKQAVAYYKQGRFDKAIQELKPDLDANPDWEFGHRLAGLCYLNLKNHALAIASLTRAAQLKSTSFATYQGLGQAYYNIERFENCLQALSDGEQYAKTPDDQYFLHYLRGSAFYRLNRFQEAVNELTGAVRVRPASDWSLFSQLGISYYNLDRLDESVESLNKALALKPGQNVTAEFLSKAYFKKGVASLSAKRYPEAIELFQKARDYAPNNGFTYYNMAEAYLFQEKYGDAEKALTQALDLMPRSAEVYQRLGLVYEKQKKWDLSLNAYQKADEINPQPSLKEAVKRVTELKKR